MQANLSAHPSEMLWKKNRMLERIQEFTSSDDIENEQTERERCAPMLIYYDAIKFCKNKIDFCLYETLCGKSLSVLNISCTLDLLDNDTNITP